MYAVIFQVTDIVTQINDTIDFTIPFVLNRLNIPETVCNVSFDRVLFIKVY